jgi:hypothetical protein
MTDANHHNACYSIGARSYGFLANQGPALYRPRFLGQFFELSSCGSFEGKQGLVSLPRGLEVEPFDQPLFVVALAEFFERFGQFFQGFEVPHPE